MDELDYARERLRRALLEWCNEIMPAITERTEGESPEVAIFGDGLALHTFPTKEFTEYRDLVIARLQTLKAEMGK